MSAPALSSLQMPSFLESNLQALGIAGHSLEKIQKASPKGCPIVLSDGSPALDINGFVLGAPAEEMSLRESVQSAKDSSEGIVVIFGLGLGHAVRELRAQTSANLVVYEPDPGVARRVLDLGPSDLGGIPILCDIEELKNFWFGFSRGRPMATLVESPGYSALYPEAYKELIETIELMVSSVGLSENTVLLRSRSWAGDVLRNVGHLPGKIPFASLKGQFQGVPAFIVGAGPSLSKNGHLLQEASRKGIIFAVNTSARALVRYGAEPQVLISIEASDHTRQLLDLPWINRVIRALSMTGHPAIWGAGTGPLFPIYEASQPFTGLKDLFGVDGLRVAGSVSTAAFSLAEVLGCSPIVYVGQDLAFTGGKMHAAGTDYEDTEVKVNRETGRIELQYCKNANEVLQGVGCPPQTSEKLTEVEAWGGEGLVASGTTWNMVRLWLEARAEQVHIERPETRLINATEGGSRIRNFEEVRLGDLLSQLPERNLTSASIVEQAYRTVAPITTEQALNWTKKQVRLTHKAEKAAEDLSRQARNTLRCLKSERPAEVKKAFQRLTQAEHRLQQSASRQPLLEAFSCAKVEMLTALLRFSTETDAQQDAKKAIQTEEHIAKVISQAAAELQAALNETADQLSSSTASEC